MLLTSTPVEAISPAMRRIQALLRRIAPTDRPVLLLGPTGCGKEIIAQQVHRYGLRPSSPLVDINCSSIPENLMEAELFGHERGAFTGAVSSRAGYFTQVGNGTLFMDEIGDLPLSLQPKLLRVLETRQFRSVGSTATLPFHGRIVAATHRDLARMVRDGSFREDLYYRLNVFSIEIPALDQRREDIPLLVQHFAASQNRPIHFKEDALKLMAQASWPGNVRQLRNVVDRIAVLADSDSIDASVVSQFLCEPRATSRASFEEITDRLLHIEGDDKLSVLEHLLVDRALRECHGNKTAAAQLLGVNRKVIERRVRSHGEDLKKAKRQIEQAHGLIAASDYRKATDALEAALDSLRGLPPGFEERRLRFEILRQLGLCRRSQDGWLSAEALDIHAEALQVGRGFVDRQELGALMFGSWTANLVRLELDQAHQLAQEIRFQGLEAEDVNLHIDGCIALANTRFWLAEFEGTLELLDELRALPDFGTVPILRQGLDPVVLAAMLEGLAAYQHGDLSRARRAYGELATLTTRLSHAFSLAIALQGCAWIQCLLGNSAETGTWAERLLSLSTTHNFTFYRGVAHILAAHAISRTRPAEAEQMMRNGFTNEMAIQGGLLFHSFYSVLLCRHYLAAGQPDRAKYQADQAIQISMERRELAYLGELLCARGKALAALGALDEATEELHSAVATAHGLGCAPAKNEAVEALALLVHGDVAKSPNAELLESVRQKYGFRSPSPVNCE